MPCYFYFYRDTAYKVIFSIWLLAGLWLWLGGRPSYHIGASGLVYGLASFIFFSGVIRREKGVMALSLLVVFLYGSMIWGLLPIIQGVSWEAHLFGGLSGLLIAWHFRKTGPQRKVYEWPDEDNEIDYNESILSEEVDSENLIENNDSKESDAPKENFNFRSKILLFL